LKQLVYVEKIKENPRKPEKTQEEAIMSFKILDPTNEAVPVTRQVTPRPEKLTGRLAFLDISKPRGNVLLDRLQEALEQRLPQIEITRYTKPTFSKPAPDALRVEIQRDNDFVIEALAD
tara:strand:+ start:3428 stop:3784 length:357 start_codon:yes stop_codon:yes gene_type:complete